MDSEQDANNDVLWPGFGEKLRDLLNVHGIDNDLNTPDYMLTRYLIIHLVLMDAFMKARED